MNHLFQHIQGHLYGAFRPRLLPTGGASAWTPLSLFAASEQGAWYDPSDFSTMFQDSAGTTPVTAVEQPVGLILDKRLGLALGAEIITNGDFSDGSTGWTFDPGWEVSGGAATKTSGGQNSIYQFYSFIGGRTYVVEFDVVAIDAGGDVYVGIGSASASFTAVGRKKAYLRPAADASLAYIAGQVNATLTVLDNISVREIPGSHASQPTAAARPVVSARVNLLTKTEDLDVADWYTPGTVTVETAIYTAPDSSVSGIRITALGFTSGISGGFTGPAARHTGSFFVRAGSTSALRFGFNDGGWLAATATIVSGSGSITGSDLFSLSGLDSNWTEVRLVTDANIPASAPRLYFYPGPDTQANGDSIGVWHPQVETGSTATRYQRVTTATDYDTVGFPHYLVFDGVDDELETTFPDLGTDVTIARALPLVGASIQTGHTISAGTWLDSTNHAGLVIVDRALTAGETTALTAYLDAKAGV